MKPLLLSVLLAIVLPASMAFADVAIYNGTGSIKTTSSGGDFSSTGKFIEIVDLATGQTQAILLGKVFGHKFYSAQASLAGNISLVTSKKTKKTKVFIGIGQQTTNGGNGVVADIGQVLSGPVSSQIVKTGSTAVSVAKSLNGGGFSLTTTSTDQAVPASYTSTTTTAALDLKGSTACNDAGNTTLANALTYVVNKLQTQGYTEF